MTSKSAGGLAGEKVAKCCSTAGNPGLRIAAAILAYLYTRIRMCIYIYTYINVFEYKHIYQDLRQSIYKPGQREAFSRNAIYILLVRLGEVGGKTRGCVPAVRVPPCTAHAHRQWLKSLPILPPQRTGAGLRPRWPEQLAEVPQHGGPVEHPRTRRGF